MNKLKLIIFSAPSGSGKTTIVKHLLQKGIKLEFSISACSREKRTGEIDKKDYYFLSAEEFKRRIKNNEFVEWEEVYKDHFYGTLKSEIERIQKNGNAVIFDVDVVGGVNLKKIFKEDALAIFIRPPAIEELKNRLIKRSTDSIDIIEKRIEKAAFELEFADQFDKIIVNDNLDIAKKEAEEIISDFLEN